MAQVRRAPAASEACTHARGDGGGLDGRPCPGHDLTVHVLPDGRAARTARAIVREALRDAGVRESEVTDAELAVGELAANADTHAWGPYELRIVLAGGHPAWCEVVDADQRLAGIPDTFTKLRSHTAPDPVHAEDPRESGRGLAIVHRLSGGRCRAFPAMMHTTGLTGKAVAFALPAAAVRSPVSGGSIGEPQPPGDARTAALNVSSGPGEPTDEEGAWGVTGSPTGARPT